MDNDHSDTLICLQTFNRRGILKFTLKRLKEICINTGAKLLITDDRSTEFDETFLEQYADFLFPIKVKSKNGPLRLTQGRKFHVDYFAKSKFEYCYFCDSDVYHHRNVLTHLKSLNRKHRIPAGAYRGYMNAKFRIGKTIRYTMGEGKSLFYSKDIPFFEHITGMFTTDRQLQTKNWEGVCYDRWRERRNGQHVIDDVSWAEHFGLRGVFHKRIINQLGGTKYNHAINLHQDLREEIANDSVLTLLATE